jgi:RNase H-like domain found in reverse transcriptase
LPWGIKETATFCELKWLLCEEAEPLGIINWDLLFVIRTDASDHTVAGVLAQHHDNGERPIVFFSKKLSGSQKNWATIEKEAFAVLEA